MKRFVLKSEANVRFSGKWFVENTGRKTGRMNNRYYQKTYATRRGNKNPIVYYTSTLNQIYRHIDET